VLGSLFSTSSYENTAEAFPAIEETATSRQPEFLATPAAQSTQGIQPARESTPAVRDVSHVEPHLRPSQHDVLYGSSDENFQTEDERVVSGQPEGPRQISAARMSFTPLVEVERGVRPSVETSGKSEPLEKTVEKVEFTLERPDQQVTRQGPYAPFVEEGSRAKEPDVFRNSRPLTSDSPRPRKKDFPGDKARPEREAEEIQIHIGRIEVTAVPPAPPRPATQPVRKSLRLDEYLNRGRERAK
jgi:hypothetical protein